VDSQYSRDESAQRKVVMAGAEACFYEIGIKFGELLLKQIWFL